jgi:hypothetical protein
MDLRTEKLMMQCHTPDAQYVGSVTQTVAANGNINMSLSGLSPQTGDVVVVTFTGSGTAFGDGGGGDDDDDDLTPFNFSWASGSISFSQRAKDYGTAGGLDNFVGYVGTAVLTGASTTIQTTGITSHTGIVAAAAVFRNVNYSSVSILDGQGSYAGSNFMPVSSIAGFNNVDVSVLTLNLYHTPSFSSLAHVDLGEYSTAASVVSNDALNVASRATRIEYGFLQSGTVSPASFRSVADSEADCEGFNYLTTHIRLVP